MLVHCKAGADRTSLASAIYVLQRTGNLELARGQIALLPYFHVGCDTWRLGAVLDLYEPFHGEVPFPEWVREHYSYPGMAEKEGTAEPEATAEPEGTLEPQGTTEPEGTAEPQGTTEPE